MLGDQPGDAEPPAPAAATARHLEHVMPLSAMDTVASIDGYAALTLWLMKLAINNLLSPGGGRQRPRTGVEEAFHCAAAGRRYGLTRGATVSALMLRVTQQGVAIHSTYSLAPLLELQLRQQCIFTESITKIILVRRAPTRLGNEPQTIFAQTRVVALLQMSERVLR
jgi:hypothetical protein